MEHVLRSLTYEMHLTWNVIKEYSQYRTPQIHELKSISSLASSSCFDNFSMRQYQPSNMNVTLLAERVAFVGAPQDSVLDLLFHAN